MRWIIRAVVLALLVSGGGEIVSAADVESADDLLFPLPALEVAAGKFESWQQEAAKKPSSITYARVEYDRAVYWVVQASFGWGDPSVKIAVYAPTKEGSYRRCLLVGPLKAGNLVLKANPQTGELTWNEAARSSTKGEVIFTWNLKTIGVLP